MSQSPIHRDRKTYTTTEIHIHTLAFDEGINLTLRSSKLKFIREEKSFQQIEYFNRLLLAIDYDESLYND